MLSVLSNYLILLMRLENGMRPKPIQNDGTKRDLENMNLALENTRRELIAIRNKYGAKSPIGHRCSNLCEMMESLPPGPEHRIEYLTADGVRYQRNRLLENVQQQTAELAKLLGAQ